jgi:hypothetical protein
LAFLWWCGGQCVGADDGRAEQRKPVAQGISRYVVNEVVHHDQTVHERKQGCGNGVGIRVPRDVPLVAPPAGQFGDVVEGLEVKRAGAFLQYRIAKGLRLGLQRERMAPAHLDGLWKIWRS